MNKIKLNSKQKLSICFTYLLGKLGLLNNIDIGKTFLIFEPVENINAKTEVFLRQQYYKNLTQTYLGEKNTIAKGMYLDVSNRKVITISLEDLSTFQGKHAASFLTQHGYECINIKYHYSYDCNNPLNNVKGVSFSNKINTYNDICSRLIQCMNGKHNIDIADLSVITLVSKIDRLYVDGNFHYVSEI